MESENNIQDTVVLVVGNQKGGVGKSTNTVSLASALAEQGQPTLVIDLDMTSGLSKMLAVPTNGWLGAFHLLTGQGDPRELIIDEHETELSLPKGVHLIPSSRELSELDNWLLKNQWISGQDLLIEPLKKLRGLYRYIILDTPPQTTKTIIPALKAADYAILSSIPDPMSVIGLNDSANDINQARSIGGAKVSLLGIIMCAMPNRKTRLSQSLTERVVTSCVDAEGRTLKFTQEISRSVVVPEAQRVGKSILEYAPDHPVSHEYRRLAREVESRIQLARQATEAAHG